MQKMIQSVINRRSPLPTNPSREDLEILTECIESGYLFSRNARDGKVLRTMDGMPHPIVDMDAVPFKGYMFLAPTPEERRSKLTISISIFAAAISVLALVCSLLTGLDQIITNVQMLISAFSG